MKKTLIALAFAAAGLAAIPSAFAQSANGNGGWFVNGNVGRTSIDKGPYDGHDTGYGINGGYRWTVTPSVALGVEAGYNDLGNINAKNIFNGDRVVDRGKSQLHGWTAGVNGHFNIDPKWYISARGGIYDWKGHGMESGSDNNIVRRGIDKTSWYAGAGVGYDFTNNVSLGINYDYYNAKKNNVDLSTDMVSVSAEYRF
ncbi:OOP family OmpA-OmpF porin/outer membrane immunogenic protein [Luteibacter rhizovicinus]|uniref:OOP family OmpA-OmpF porin/outer membrane immunogenic protein n=1 Tax=Luteibacter rhizovicinus TaxID=242606 RepID=A0A4R3YTG1_9GAMM|nr:porin family protein [Luteibacter rhizovicinus]TCV95790.1 OOP family OmpA-OmpF porin/outer membrane immunogenic protein [Luteibacter rhizovicinus]